VGRDRWRLEIQNKSFFSPPEMSGYHRISASTVAIAHKSRGIYIMPKQHRRGVILAPMLDHADRCNEIALAFYLSTYDHQLFVARKI
jgi:hypothetical protein